MIRYAIVNSQIFSIFTKAFIYLFIFKIKTNHVNLLFFKVCWLLRKKINPCLYCSSNRVIIHGSDAAIIPQLLKNFYKLNQTNLNQKNYADCLTTATSSCSKIKKKYVVFHRNPIFLIKQHYFFPCRISPHYTYQYVIFSFWKMYLDKNNFSTYASC